MILLHLESPDMQLSNHQNFLFGNSLPVHCLYASLIYELKVPKGRLWTLQVTGCCSLQRLPLPDTTTRRGEVGWGRKHECAATTRVGMGHHTHPHKMFVFLLLLHCTYMLIPTLSPQPFPHSSRIRKTRPTGHIFCVRLVLLHPPHPPSSQTWKLVSAWREGWRTCRTPRMCPTGHICGVLVE